MMDLRQRQIVFALLALLLVFAGCKGESPTAPDTGENPPGTPPVGAVVSITFSNPDPMANSATNVTATVTVNGQPAPAGTAVEFSTTLGTFADTDTNSTLATTNAQGQATVSLESTEIGTATVTAVVNNVVQRATVTFRTDTGPQQPGAPTVAAINPDTIRDEGGELVTIMGTNFQEPVRVFFNVNGAQVEAQVVSVTPTQLQVFAPAVDLAAGQTAEATVTIFTQHGTANERRVTSTETVTFRRTQLTPVVSGISPPSGPLEGGTQTTIFGDGFESFVQVFFGLAEAEIIRSDFNSIVVVTPNSRETTVDATPVAGEVPIRIRNIDSNTETTFTGFRYASAMQIVAVGPTEGPFTGGTRVTIEGVGFDDPVAVTIGGVAAADVQVTGTKIIAITSPVTVTGCSDETGPISVTNISTGASAVSDIEFTYRVPQPIIVSATPTVQPGGTVTVVVAGAFGFPRLRLGTRVLSITSETPSADGSVTTFTAVIPTNIELDTETCAGVSGVEAPQPTDFDITYESATTGCSDTLQQGVTVEPIPVPRLAFSPVSLTPFTATFVPGNPAAVPPTSDTITPSATQTLNVVNGGVAPLTINSITQIGAGCSAFTVSAPPTPQTLAQCEIAPITVRYIGASPAARGTQSCTVTVDTNAGARSFTLTGTTP